MNKDIDPIIEEFRHIEEEFNIEEAPVIEVEPESMEVIEVSPTEIIESVDTEKSYSDELSEKRKEDYEYARTNIKMAIEQGAEAMEDLLNIAKSSEQPRAYEVIANLLRGVVESNEKLIDINKKVDDQEMDEGIKVVEKEQQVQNQQNNYFIGSTAELQDMIKEQQTKIIEGVVEKMDEEEKK